MHSASQLWVRIVFLSNTCHEQLVSEITTHIQITLQCCYVHTEASLCVCARAQVSCLCLVATDQWVMIICVNYCWIKFSSKDHMLEQHRDRRLDHSFIHKINAWDESWSGTSEQRSIVYRVQSMQVENFDGINNLSSYHIIVHCVELCFIMNFVNRCMFFSASISVFTPTKYSSFSVCVCVCVCVCVHACLHQPNECLQKLTKVYVINIISL